MVRHKLLSIFYFKITNALRGAASVGNNCSTVPNTCMLHTKFRKSNLLNSDINVKALQIELYFIRTLIFEINRFVIIKYVTFNR